MNGRNLLLVVLLSSIFPLRDSAPVIAVLDSSVQSYSPVRNTTQEHTLREGITTPTTPPLNDRKLEDPALVSDDADSMLVRSSPHVSMRWSPVLVHRTPYLNSTIANSTDKEGSCGFTAGVPEYSLHESTPPSTRDQVNIVNDESVPRFAFPFISQSFANQQVYDEQSGTESPQFGSEARTETESPQFAFETRTENESPQFGHETRTEGSVPVITGLSRTDVYSMNSRSELANTD